MLSEYQTERIIEVGPTDTLTNMVKRTRDLKYRQQDAANFIQRRFLSSKRDRCHIYHVADDSQSVPKSSSTAQPLATKSQNLADPSTPKAPNSEPMKLVPVIQMPAAAIIQKSESAQMVSLIPAATIPTTRMAKIIPDIPVNATEIIRAVVACALKKDPKGLSFSSTIKTLAGGRPSNVHMNKRSFADKYSRQVNNSERDCW